jgi:hypothetical protein
MDAWVFALDLSDVHWDGHDDEMDGNFGKMFENAEQPPPEVLRKYIPLEAGGATKVFVLCPNGANRGMFYDWTRRWTVRGNTRSVECSLFVVGGALVPNLLDGLHSCEGNEGGVLLSVAETLCKRRKCCAKRP